MHKYKAHTIGEAARIIVDEVAAHGESYWEGAQDPENRELYEGLKTFMKKKGIIPLNDMFGSWVSTEKANATKPYDVTVRFSVDAVDEDDAKDQWELRRTNSHETLNVVCTQDPSKVPLHIVYWAYQGGFRYRQSDGSTGTTKDETAEMFESYWKSLYKGRVVTFEDIT